MLKIRDNVDLKELEKFGFEYYEDMNEWFYYEFTKPSDTSEIRINIRINIRNDNRNIHPSFDFNINQDSIYDKIFDLIKAGLVEKVGD